MQGIKQAKNAAHASIVMVVVEEVVSSRKCMIPELIWYRILTSSMHTSFTEFLLGWACMTVKSGSDQQMKGCF